jgi:hypothetical protein
MALQTPKRSALAAARVTSRPTARATSTSRGAAARMAGLSTHMAQAVYLGGVGAVLLGLGAYARISPTLDPGGSSNVWGLLVGTGAIFAFGAALTFVLGADSVPPSRPARAVSASQPSFGRHRPSVWRRGATPAGTAGSSAYRASIEALRVPHDAPARVPATTGTVPVRAPSAAPPKEVRVATGIDVTTSLSSTPSPAPSARSAEVANWVAAVGSEANPNPARAEPSPLTPVATPVSSTVEDDYHESELPIEEPASTSETAAESGLEAGSAPLPTSAAHALPNDTHCAECGRPLAESERSTRCGRCSHLLCPACGELLARAPKDRPCFHDVGTFA